MIAPPAQLSVLAGHGVQVAVGCKHKCQQSVFRGKNTYKISVTGGWKTLGLHVNKKEVTLEPVGSYWKEYEPDGHA